MQLWDRYGGSFQFLKVLNHNSLHRNVIMTREVLWVNLFTKYLVSLCIIMCAFAFTPIVSTHKHVIMFTWTMIFYRDVKMWQIKSQNFNIWNVIFWMKIQNNAWFQPKNFCVVTFPCSTFCTFMHEGHVLPSSGKIYFCKEQELIFL